MVKLKDQYVSGESIRFVVSAVSPDFDGDFYVVLSCGLERHEFPFSEVKGVVEAVVDSSLIGVNHWGYTVWRAAGVLREVVRRGSFDVVDEGVEFVSPLERARRNVEVLKDARMGIFASGVKRNKVRDREVERFSPQELLDELKFWEREVYKLELAAGEVRRKNLRFMC